MAWYFEGQRYEDELDLHYARQLAREKLWREINGTQQLPEADNVPQCGRCGSRDIWEDNLHYGCRRCGQVRLG